MDALSTVKASESRLLAAMLASDIAVLSELIDDRLVFTGPDGTVLTKELDLETHRSGLLKLTVLESLDTSFHSIENLVVRPVRSSWQDHSVTLNSKVCLPIRGCG